MKINNKYHKEILKLIVVNSGTPTQHTFLDSYLGNSHKRYPINAPTLRLIAKEWMKEHIHLTVDEFENILTSLITGESATEKCMAGLLLDYCKKEQCAFNPSILDSWLDNLVGWAEIDTLCTGKYPTNVMQENWPAWEKLLSKLSKSKNVNKRRASIVLLVSPIRKIRDERFSSRAFTNIEWLKHEKDILITKAISWLLRSMYKEYNKEVRDYLDKNINTLPKIAVRETLVKLETGRKSGKV